MITSFDVIIFYDKKLGEGGFAKVYEADWQGTRVAVKKLDEKLDNTSIGAIVENAQHHGHSAKATQRGFDWTAGEQEGTTWFPQGITGSSDAHASGTYAHHRIIAVSWYDHEGIPDCPLICGSVASVHL